MTQHWRTLAGLALLAAFAPAAAAASIEGQYRKQCLDEMSVVIWIAGVDKTAFCSCFSKRMGTFTRKYKTPPPEAELKRAAEAEIKKSAKICIERTKS